MTETLARPTLRHERGIHLGKPFPLLDQPNKRGSFDDSHTGVTFLETEVWVNTGMFPDFDPFTVDLQLSRMEDTDPMSNVVGPRSRAEVINPFFYEQGYRVTNEDYSDDPDVRSGKIAGYKDAVRQVYDGVEQRVVTPVLFARSGPYMFDLSPGQKATMERRLRSLTLGLYFPTGIKLYTHLDKEVTLDKLDGANFQANGFYNPEIPEIQFGLMLPMDVNRLGQINARLFRTTTKAI